MFAFGLWDRRTRSLSLVRDRFGEKPLYYGWVGQDFVFGSELKAFRAHPSFDNVISRRALSDYTARVCVPAPLSMYERIFKLPPASILVLSGDRAPAPADRPSSATAHSKLCGSTVTVDLKMDGDTVTDFAHEVKACALGQASSSIMARHVVGAKADELRKLRDTVRKMLKENGAPPKDGKWADIAVLEPVRDYKARHASTLLTFDAVVDAIGQIEGKRRAAAG